MGWIESFDGRKICSRMIASDLLLVSKRLSFIFSSSASTGAGLAYAISSSKTKLVVWG